jgi:tetratricopeptide (TPR) repeat protein
VAIAFQKYVLIPAVSAILLVTPLYAAGGGGGGGGGSPSQTSPAYDPAVDYQKGTAAFRAKDYKTAAKMFQKVSSAVPKDPAAQYLLGASYMGLNDYKKALKPLQNAVKYNKNMIEAHRDLGLVLVKLGMKDKAAAELADLSTRQSACDAAKCADAAKLADAVTKLTAAIADGGKTALSVPSDIRIAAAQSADVTYVSAVSLINEKRYEEAIANLQDARWAAGPHPDILVYLGFANRKLHRYDLAEDYYQTALAIDPQHRGALEYYGELKLERGNVAGAKANLARLDAICGFGCYEADELRRWITQGVPSAG